MTPILQQRITQFVKIQRQHCKINEFNMRYLSSCIHKTFQDTTIDKVRKPGYSSTMKLSTQSQLTQTTVSDPSNNEIGLRKVLIANRGEIACRVQRTCHKWDIPTVAIYSSADTCNALHAQLSSECYQIGTGPAVSDSYLRMDDIISIALNSNCDSIHPGYGFLSENAIFAQKCQDYGLKFIGPSANAITLMGDKAQSKAIMDQAGVPTTPGYYDASTNNIDSQNIDFLYTKAIEIGFPLLIKAVAGGGGKGMRIVWKESDFCSALQSCQNEAYNNFGNSVILLEKYLVKPRHIEMQIIADKYGNVIHLQERDCSVQRRHQKVFEEAPAIDLHNDLRIKFGEMAVKAAQAVQYVNAGTVEFLLDTSTSNVTVGTADQQFYFCEMNTRLQVEHPVTELITGIDLVELQLRVAAEQKLPVTDQNEIPCNGHAIEARIYAERQTPDGGFLPATGTLWYHNYDTLSRVPTTSNDNTTTTVRVDTGLRRTTSNDEQTDLPSVGNEQSISVYYDPMISKLIVHGPDRSIALKQLIHSLKGYHIAGVPTNIPFLINCAKHAIFKLGGKYVTTGFLDDYGSDVKVLASSSSSASNNKLCQVIGSFVVMLHLENRLTKIMATAKNPWSTHWGSWRIGANNIPQQTIRMKNGMAANIWKYKDGSYDIQPIDNQNNSGTKYHIDGWMDSKTNTVEVIINKLERIQLTAVVRITTDSIHSDTISIRMWPKTIADNTEISSSWELDVVNPMVSNTSSSTTTDTQTSTSGVVKSPMPGKVTRINYCVGDTVNQGDIIVVMEAMKMEHPLIASCNGTIQSIHYTVDDIIMKDGSIVFVIQPAIIEDVAA
jgi:3-methylcrotonyl-CoA carboxylase alpha subunit